MCTGTCCRIKFALTRRKSAANQPVRHSGSIFTHSILMQRNAHAGLLRRLEQTGVKLTEFDWEPATEDGKDGMRFVYEVEGTQAQIDQFKAFVGFDTITDTEE